MHQFEAVVKELSGQLRSAKPERRKERKEMAVNGDAKYHAVERLISVSTLLCNPTYYESTSLRLIWSIHLKSAQPEIH